MIDLGGVTIRPIKNWCDELAKVEPVSLTEAFKTATETLLDESVSAKHKRMAAYLIETVLGRSLDRGGLQAPSTYTDFYDVVSDMVGHRGAPVELVLEKLRDRLFDLPSYTVEEEKTPCATG